jgi:sugar lactone lactonase YvrE
MGSEWQEITSGLQFPEGPVAMAAGSVIVVEIRRGTLTRVRPDGRHEIVAELGGGPNGAAVGPDAPCTSATTAAPGSGGQAICTCPAVPWPITAAGGSSASTCARATPDPVTTNICFGGADMRDAWVTCSSSGRLLKARWPRPGLRLPFHA